MAHSFEGAKVLITAINSGVGSAIGEELASRGADIVGTRYHTDGLQEAASRIGKYRKMFHVVSLDQTDPSSIQRAVSDAKYVLGGLDMLVTVASRQSEKSFLEMSSEEIEQQVKVNLTGAMWLIQEAVKAMIEYKGKDKESRHRSICAIGSIRGLIPLKPDAYEASKAGILHLVKGLATEFGPHEISVNAVAPGTIDSLIEHVRYESNAEAYRKAWDGVTPGNIATPKGVAESVAHLLSSESINGEILRIDGGFSQKHSLPLRPTKEPNPSSLELRK